jgi:predicted secreted protein
LYRNIAEWVIIKFTWIRNAWDHVLVITTVKGAVTHPAIITYRTICITTIIPRVIHTIYYGINDLLAENWIIYFQTIATIISNKTLCDETGNTFRITSTGCREGLGGCSDILINIH